MNGVVFTPTTSLLSSLEYGGGTDLASLTLGDGEGDASVNGVGLLTIGTTYAIQVWYVDTRSGAGDVKLLSAMGTEAKRPSMTSLRSEPSPLTQPCKSSR